MNLDVLVGRTREEGLLHVTRERLRLFARAIRQTSPSIFTDIDMARAAGHPDPPVPPTVYFTTQLTLDDAFAYLTDVGVDLRTVLHGEQEFSYFSVAHAGDVLSSRSEITDQTDSMVAELLSTTIIRLPDASTGSGGAG